ncbi:hypothetical protein ABE493_12780 [Stenotrophomonas terrae]|uniref:hypothetical protein n=1 Tax=Stenotrophomonas terrae TaxID=405446 RepID=UPI00320AFA6C
MKTADMLTPEERELARLLGRPGRSAATPSAQLDARIIAMANAAQAPAAVDTENPAPEQTQATAPTPLPSAARRSSGWGRRRGLVSSLAVAASLVLVVGLAWQLRPLDAPPAMPAQAEANVAVAAAESAADSAAAAAQEPSAAPPAAPMMDQLPVDVAAAPAAASPPAEAAAKEHKAAAPKPAPADGSRKDETTVAEPASGAIAERAPRAFSPAPVIAPPAPPAPPAPMVMPAPVQAPVYTEQAGNADAPQNDLYRTQSAPARTAPPRPALTGPAPIPHAGTKAVTKAAEARRQRAAAIAADSTPDIEADATLSRHQWIKRIRERLEAGDLDGAKASLRRFAHDYPEARIPRDLRPLLED